MIKTILYTSNPDVRVNSLDDVKDFAACTGKYYSCIAKQGTDLYDLKEGAHILTNKGNNVYVLEVEDGAQEYDDAKKTNITGIVQVDYPFGEPEEDLFSGIKDAFNFNKVDDVRMTFDGKIVVRTPKGYVSMNDKEELVRFPQAMTIDVPVYTMPKAKSQLAVGDIMVSGNSYAKITKITDNKIFSVSFKGTGRVEYPIKDFLMNDSFVQVVMTPFNGQMMAQNGQINPMMFALMGKNSDSLSTVMMMQMMNGQGAQGINPMMLLALNNKKKDDDTFKTLLMMQMMNGQNPFAAQPAVAQPAEENK